MGTLAVIICSVAISLVSMGVQEGISHFQGKVSDKLVKLGKELYTKMSKNSTLKNRVIEAYSRRDNQLLTDIMYGAGFGPRLEALKNEREKSRKEYDKTINDLDEEQKDLQNKYNQVSSAQYGNGTISGVVHSNDVYKNVSQQIEGGINNGEK